ncbi:MAG: NADH:flavin oxidoreductase/NADH oxidase [Hyphomicrobiales bacterium]
MSALFSPISMRGMSLKNRIVVAPMCQYIARDGIMHDWHLMHLGQFTMGAAGLVMTEATHVSSIGRITPGCAGLWNDEQEAAMKRIVDFSKAHGVAKMGIQLAHAGRKGSCRTPLNGDGPLHEDEAPWKCVAPSAMPFSPDWPVPEALDEAGMQQIKAQFIEAAKRAERVGFETAELHAAHGYLLNQFLSPLSNKRTDGYGGNHENRMRYVLEIFEALRDVWPADKPLGIRLSAVEWVEGGSTIEDTMALSKELEAIGCDYIDVSSGGLDYRQKIKAGPSYQVGFAQAIKKEVDIPVMAVGLITTARQAEEIVSEGKADFVMLARGMMDDPHWAWHAAGELGAKTEYPPQYIRCSPEYWRHDRKI